MVWQGKVFKLLLGKTSTNRAKENAIVAMEGVGWVSLKVPKGGREINWCKMISIIFKRTNTLRQNKIPIGLTVAIMALTITCRTNDIVFMIYKKVMST